MHDIDRSLTPHTLVRALGKPAASFTKADIVRFVQEQGITMLDLRYVAGDGRLKKLNFAIGSLEQLDRILTLGERVDGSSLFPFVGAAAGLWSLNRSRYCSSVITASP